jgi:hypothetical protein
MMLVVSRLCCPLLHVVAAPIHPPFLVCRWTRHLLSLINRQRWSSFLKADFISAGLIITITKTIDL